MLCTLRLPGATVAGTLLAFVLTACAPRADQRAGGAPPVAMSERAREELQRRLHVAQLLLAKARTEIELGDLRYRDQVRHAEMELELAKRRQQSFAKFTVPHRLARAELSLQQAEDGVLEARAELQQLQQESSATRPAGLVRDQTAVTCAQRRLQRLERDLELRRDEFKTLKEVTLPLEQSELDLAAEVKKRAVLQAQRDNEGPLIDRQIAVLKAEAEVTRLEELADGREKAGELSPAASEPSR
jgi:hypothetical protein